MTPSLLNAAIKNAGITRREAAELVHIKPRALDYQLSGKTPVRAALYELLLLKTGQAKISGQAVIANKRKNKLQTELV